MSYKGKNGTTTPREAQIRALERKLDNLGKLIQSHQASYESYIQMLSSMVGHDMKNCLLTIDGLLYNKKNGGEWTENDIHELELSLGLMHDSIEQFQNVSMVSDTTRFELGNLVAAVKSIHRNVFQKEQIRFDISAPEHSIMVIQPYHTIQIIVNNLIINSIKALTEVSDKRIGLEVFVVDETCHIRVKDNGPAIDSSICKKIFKYGFSTTGGSGIGLFQVKELLKRMNGGIEVETEPEDSIYVKSFSIYFPLKEKELQ